MQRDIVECLCTRIRTYKHVDIVNYLFSPNTYTNAYTAIYLNQIYLDTYTTIYLAQIYVHILNYLSSQNICTNTYPIIFEVLNVLKNYYYLLETL